jgi:methionyl-tRNA formyltransferase
MLVEGIRKKLFVPPIQPVNPSHDNVTHAKKLTTQDRWMDPSWDSSTLVRRERILGPLWAMLPTDSGEKRANFTDITKLPRAVKLGSIPVAAGELCIVHQEQDQDICWMASDQLVKVGSLTVDGLAPQKALVAVKKAKLLLKDVHL